ncbi:protein SNORC isoform X2 [Pan paniscus]|uniref:protein SNORC isoform X2 n=1 Tax=Pan paniscus TaxID=9597 RepID=UPI003004CEE8
MDGPGRCSTGARAHAVERAGRAAVGRRPRGEHQPRPGARGHRSPSPHRRARTRGQHRAGAAGPGRRVAGARRYRGHRDRRPAGHLRGAGARGRRAEKVFRLLKRIKGPRPAAARLGCTPHAPVCPRVRVRACSRGASPAPSNSPFCFWSPTSGGPNPFPC